MRIKIISALITLSLSGLVHADPTIDLLANLSNANGAPGFESHVRKVLLPIWQNTLANVKVDGIGNITGTLAGTPNSPTILLMAHLDEVGLVVRDITENGFLQVDALGGMHGAIAQQWIISTKQGDVLGYSGTESGHIIPHPDQTTKPIDNSIPIPRDIFIDVGATSKQDAEQRFGMRSGLPITPDTKFAVLNHTNNYLGKAFDDRAGLALITLLAQQLQHQPHPNTLGFAATVQEEVGMRGSQVIYNEIKPDVVINLEICITGDFPLHTAVSTANYPALGKGPCVYVYDRNMIASPNLVDWITRVAKENNIPYQYATGLNYGQDGASLQLSGQGMPVINIGIPLRYAHQQAGVINRADFDATLKLLDAIVKKLDGKQLKVISSD